MLSVQFLASKFGCSRSHSNQYKENEIEVLSKKYKYLKHEGLGQVYKKYLDSGYKRSYESICKQITVENSVMIESKRRFSSEEEIYKLSERYGTRTNNIVRKILNFKMSNEMVKNHFNKDDLKYYQTAFL